MDTYLYKIVRKDAQDGTVFLSLVQNGELEMQYRIGEISTASIGYVFCYSNTKSVTEYIRSRYSWQSSRPPISILRCVAMGRIYTFSGDFGINYFFDIGESVYAEEFWSIIDTNSKNTQSRETKLKEFRLEHPVPLGERFFPGLALCKSIRPENEISFEDAYTDNYETK